MNLKSLNERFSIENKLEIIAAKNGLPFIQVENSHATALISIYGAHVLSYQSNNTDDKHPSNNLLFVSENSIFEKGKSIRGGIPICWPWFGDDPENLGRPTHGFARNTMWNLEETNATANGSIQIILSLTDTEESLKLWPYSFKLSLAVTIGNTLQLSLKTTNTGHQAFTISQALHSYFSIEDIEQIKVKGLDGTSYLDKTQCLKSFEQEGDVTIADEVDRVYENAPEKVTIDDMRRNKNINIVSTGSKTTVIWNPWKKISEQKKDFEDDDYRRFVCVETANAFSNSVIIPPEKSHTMEAKYSVRFK